MIQEEGLKLMMIYEGSEQRIRSRFISNWFKIDSYVQNKEMLISEIEKIDPDVVLIDLEVYEKMDGVETSWKIRNHFDIPV
jgi:chemotaxis response regulator CheB